MFRDEIIHSTDGMRAYKIKNNHSCQTRNLVYFIYCQTCQKPIYVGETERKLQERAKEHLADIRHQRHTPVAEHFNTGNHNISDASFSILEKIHDESKIFRLVKERDWMLKLRTVKPEGVNIKSNLNI